MTPTLHLGYQNVPLDGTGRLGGSAVDMLTCTRHDTLYWIPHTAAEAMYARTHDRYYRLTDGGWALRWDRLRNYTEDGVQFEGYGALIDRLANACLDFCEETAGGRPMDPHHVRVVVDLEHKQLDQERWLYGEHEFVRGYGSRDVMAMTLLCNRIQYHGGRRWGREVIAAPYMPLRPNGDWSGLREVPEEFARIWRGDRMGPLVDRMMVWGHNYVNEQPTFSWLGQTLRNYTASNIRDQFKAILNLGANPLEVWVANWWFEKPIAAAAKEVMLGVRDVLTEREWPWETHLIWSAGWKTLNGILDAPVEQVSEKGDPLELSISAASAGKAIAQAWVNEVEAPYKAVFAEVTA